MIVKTTAVVLRYAPFSNTSRMVSWLTADYGKITTTIKGSQRPKSQFLGQYDLFYTCELLFYAREHHQAHIIRECSPLKPRSRFRSDWKACAAASYLTDLVSRSSQADAPHPEVFELLDAGLDFLAASGADESFVFWFELRLLEHLGLAPRLQNCMDCGRDLVTGVPHMGFSYARGGILCAGCARAAPPRDAVPLSSLAAARLAGWQGCADPSSTQAEACPRRTWRECETALGAFLRYHLNLPLPSRDAALDALWQQETPFERG